MLLYIWINKYRHINRTGFNLSSNYEFNFNTIKTKSILKKIKGNLTCTKKNNPKIFSNQIYDIRAIIGENGSGKSTLLEMLIQNIMTKPSHYFDGFFVTDKFIFNRSGIDFGDSISEIRHFSLKTVSNVELVNYNRDEFQKKLRENEVKTNYNGQIATSHLNNLSIIHYSPLLNIDNVLNNEGLAGSSKTWETDYWHYYDYTTENCIVNDYHSLSISESNYFITGESELLAHKSAESIRNLEFLSDPIFEELPFKNRIDKITIRLNDFYERFWESIDFFLKSDNELEGRIQQVIRTISGKDFKKQNTIKRLESNLYVAFIYGALKYEYNYLVNFSNETNKSNALISTINKFLDASQKTRIHKTSLQLFLKSASFPRRYSRLIFKKIKAGIDFILKSKTVLGRNENDFTISLKNPDTVKKFVRLFYDDFVFGTQDDRRQFIFHIFSFDYVGLSSGEKNLLSMFSRIKKAAESIPKTQTEVVFLLDEPEVTLHPQWQTSFIRLVNDNFPKLFPRKKLQIIILSHSPILVSDLPKNNILFLEKDDKTGECKVSELKEIKNTFGANIHSLYADAFFLRDKGGAMGEFAKRVIKNVIHELEKEDPQNPSYLESIIRLIGEPLIQNQLMELFYKKFPEYRIQNIDDRITYLEKELKTFRQLKNKQV